MKALVAALMISGWIMIWLLAGHTCRAGDLSNRKLTPGAIDPALTTDCCLCNRSWSTRRVRNVPESEKIAVYREYGILHHKPGEFEIDHLISLEIGGSNSIRNLWPEHYSEPWGAHTKDRYENWLHQQVCANKIRLQDAQYRISHDWISHYKKDLGNPYATKARGQ